MMMAYGKDYEVSYIVSINFRANLDAQNAEIVFPGFKFQTFSIDIPHEYIISQKGPFSKNAPPPQGKILKKGPDKISNKVVCTCTL
jgi:hypothetical protein